MFLRKLSCTTIWQRRYMTQQFAKFENKCLMERYCPKSCPVHQFAKKNCIEAELKNLHNFNPDEEVAKFAKKIVMELQFPKRLSRMSICKEYDKLQKHNFDPEFAKNH